MPEMINQIVTSPITNVILILLLFFQWDRQYAKEQSLKYILFSIRRMISRISEVPDSQMVKEKAPDLIDTLDACLATLGARSPFMNRMQETLSMIKDKFVKESSDEIKKLPSEISEDEKIVKS